MKEDRRGRERGERGAGGRYGKKKDFGTLDYTRSSFPTIRHINQDESQKETVQTVLM